VYVVTSLSTSRTDGYDECHDFDTVWELALQDLISGAGAWSATLELDCDNHAGRIGIREWLCHGTGY
jgi:hypothetical protein